MSIVHIPFYPSDWLAGTAALSDAEKGVYITLVARMYEMAGPIERDDNRLYRVCGSKSKASFVKALNYLISEGKIIETPDGLISAPIISDWEAKYRKTQTRPWVPLAIQRFVFDRDGNKCRYCGCEDGPFHLDHVVPWRICQEHDPKNLTVACSSCNWSKGGKTLAEWRGF